MVGRYFNFNAINGLGRTEPLDIEKFLNDLKSVFEKHKVTLIKKGSIGFDKNNNFGITEAELDVSNKNNYFPLPIKAEVDVE
ncbi:hypothetical protein FZC83_01865 [Rossellomorea marisflavi]|uniref:Uncharacterized protein n=1 Tax=Rossellomorea marisflavi TaxID=189381 RepID=A0A5D4S3A5_9BACI|nr:hypothetical protein [Rossellomorea marisflavi]TYS56342.1 hypothetical protein FZC83_01865 [Rossellomorea marisflavi]